MAISQVAMFITSDGKSFTSVEAAEAHEFSLEAAGEMDTFIANNDINPRTASTLKKYIPDFIAQMGYMKAPTQIDFAADTDNPVPEDTPEAGSVVNFG